MIIDAHTVPKDAIIETELCIVGAGAAGITLAREFIGQSIRVCLLESGGLTFDPATQSLYEGENVGLPYPLDGARLRYFGGTTNHWGGTCRPLDEDDFEAADWIPYSGWPFGRSHLDPYYERAQPVCQLGPFAYDVETWETPATPALPFTGNQVSTTIFQFSPPTRFGKTYRDEIIRAGNVTAYLNANVVDIETTRNGGRVTGLRAATLGGNKFGVSAKNYILALGGIENPRLLLLSNKVQKAGLGNHNDLVGRFYMDHPHLIYGKMFLSNPATPTGLYKERHVVKSWPVMGVLTLSKEARRREKLLNYCVELQDKDKEKDSEGGVESLKYLYWKFRKGELPDHFWRHLRNVISDLDHVAGAAEKKLFTPAKSSGGHPPGKMLLPRIQLEQTPNPDSRVTLSDERDELGQNRVRLNWQLTELDKYSLKRGMEIIGQELGRSGLGRLRIPAGEIEEPWMNNHPMGTTRMHSDPKKGVVDENCRVHGISNLFMAGSSVFPTTGFANPTLTIVALAIRLADHLKGLLS